MTNVFEDLRIVAIDVSASCPAIPPSNLVNIVLTLSGSAPDDWSAYFNVRWNSHIYILKRAAHICANHLEICCVPKELEAFHLPELKAVIAETNQVYRQFLPKEREYEAGQFAKLNLDKDMRLQDLMKNIKFD